MAEKLSDIGRIVTQIHTTGEGKVWSFWGVGCATHSHSDGNYVVTSDGRKHKV